MSTVIDFTLDKFICNKKLLTKYTKRQLQAIYELLEDKRMDRIIRRKLYSEGLIELEVLEEQVEAHNPFWNEYKEQKFIIRLKDEDN